MPAGITLTDTMFSVRKVPLARPRRRPRHPARHHRRGDRALRPELVREPRADRDRPRRRRHRRRLVASTLRADPRVVGQRPPGHPPGPRDRRRALPRCPERRGLPVHRPADRHRNALRDRGQPPRRSPRLGARPLAGAHRGRRGPRTPVRAADEQPRWLDGRRRGLDAGARRLPEHAELGTRAGRGRGTRSATPRRSESTYTRPAASSISRSTTTGSSSRSATPSPRSASRRPDCDACSTNSTRRVQDDVASDRARRSREQTKQRITELFANGDTQGNAPRTKWAAVNAVIEHADWIRPVNAGSERFGRVIDDSLRKTHALDLIAAT